MERQFGTAHGLFKSNSKPERIERALRGIKAEPAFKFPFDLSVSLSRIRAKDIDGDLANIGPKWAMIVARDEKESKKKATFLVTAVLPDATNKRAAGDLGDVLSRMYQFTKIFGRQDIPVVEVFFKDKHGVFVAKTEVDKQ